MSRDLYISRMRGEATAGDRKMVLGVSSDLPDVINYVSFGVHRMNSLGAMRGQK